MTPEPTRGSESESGASDQGGDARRYPRPTRRCVLLGVGLAGLGGTLAGCSTAAVPYDANEAGVAPGGQAQAAMATSGAMASPMRPSSAPASSMPDGGMQSGGMQSGGMQSGGMQSGGMQSGGIQSGSMPSGGMQSEAPKKAAKLTGTVLGAASEIPAGGGKIYTAAKVVVTQPARGQYRAFSAICTHVGCIVNEVANGTIDCPCHGSEFKITTGAVVTGPAPSPLPKKQIKIVNGMVVLL
jgi:Rieske Fe-S protein